MPTVPPPPLAAEYRMPDVRRGDRLELETVDGITDARIPWPYTRSANHGKRLILCGDLIEAVRCESVSSVAWNWGVSRSTVQAWRRALGVGAVTPGTAALIASTRRKGKPGR